ncbi:hypothetical protein Plhal304r1_c015g0054961 [Plasmopara halstedii]
MLQSSHSAYCDLQARSLSGERTHTYNTSSDVRFQCERFEAVYVAGFGPPDKCIQGSAVAIRRLPSSVWVPKQIAARRHDVEHPEHDAHSHLNNLPRYTFFFEEAFGDEFNANYCFLTARAGWCAGNTHFPARRRRWARAIRN